MDPANRRIVLSVRAYMDDATAEDLAAFNAKFGTKRPLPPETDGDKRSKRQADEMEDVEEIIDEEI
jgi:hypothetical protein